MLKENMVFGLRILRAGYEDKFIIDFKRALIPNQCVINDDVDESEGSYSSCKELEPWSLTKGRDH